MVAIKYGQTRLGDLRVHSTAGKRRNEIDVVQRIEVDSLEMQPTARFWRSFFQLYQVSESVFRYFGYREVFERIASRVTNDVIRYACEQPARGAAPPQLLAISSPRRPVIERDQLDELTGPYRTHAPSYSNGVVTTVHRPRNGRQPIAVGADEFSQMFYLETPIDGYGNPRVFLAVERLICSNGIVARTASFASEIRCGKEPEHALRQTLEGFENGSGYAALRERIAAAQTSWASLREYKLLYRTLSSLTDSNRLNHSADVLDRLYQMAGRPNEEYGLANVDAISVKKQRVLPVKCRTYDLLNFASEEATHRATPWAQAQLNDYVGRLVSDEFDLEGTAESTDFADVFWKGKGEG
jgi:hypothetical protein